MRKATKKELKAYEEANRTWAFNQTTENFDAMQEAGRHVPYADQIRIGEMIHKELVDAIYKKHGYYYIP